jgi:Fe-S oxidoreductase
MQHEEILHRCFRCGYCKLPGNYVDFNCPAYLAFRFETYSPGGRMWLMRAWLDNKIETSKRFQQILFSCVTCGNCVENCTFPKFKDQLLLAFTAGKEELVNAGKVPPAVRDCLEKFYNHGNPYGLAQKKRSLWAEGLEIDIFLDHEYLFFPGDVGCYDSRGQEIARSVAELLKAHDISFGILGAAEVSDGNEVNAMGEKELFKFLAEKNIKAFDNAGVKKIIALSPHAYNIFKNDYVLFGGQYQVFHYSQILASIVKNFKFKSDVPTVRVTYHDSCYLGRHNNEYWSARTILSALPGIEHVEMDRNLQNSLCCGGGGGNFFTDILGSAADNPARARIREAAGTGAQILAVACPLCAIMYEDALKVENLDGKLEVKEISEIVRERIISKLE